MYGGAFHLALALCGGLCNCKLPSLSALSANLPHISEWHDYLKEIIYCTFLFQFDNLKIAFKFHSLLVLTGCEGNLLCFVNPRTQKTGI